MAVILTCYYKPKAGGLCKRLFRAINALLSAGHDVHYLAVAPFPIVHPRCHFHRFPWPENRTDMLFFWGTFHLLAPLFMIYIGYRYRATHGFTFGHTYSLIMQPLRLLKHIPLALFLHGDSLKNHSLKGRHFFLLLLETLFEKLAFSGVRLFCVSQSLSEKVRSRQRVLYSRHPGILKNNIDKMPKPLHCGKQYSYPLRLSCVGRIEKGKNQRFLIDVMKTLDTERDRLFLFGAGPQEAELKNLVREKGMEERISFMGWTEPEEIYSSIDLLLMPSLHEGCPLAVLEALENGIPILASNLPELREILPSSSLLSLENPERWGTRLKEIIKNPSSCLSEMLTAQQPYAEKLCFDWNERIVDAILS